MENFKGTKGKWEYSGGDNSSIDIVLENNSNISIDRFDRYGNGLVGSREEMEANAKLISKAPELLAKLQYLCEMNILKEHEQSVLKLIKEVTEL